MTSPALARPQDLGPAAVLDQADDAHVRDLGRLVDAGADLEVPELRVDLLFPPLGLPLPGEPGPLLLLLELAGEAGLVDGQRLFPGQLLRQVEREAEGVVELEDLVAREDGAALVPGLADDLVEEPETGRKGVGEALLLGQADLGDVLDRAEELGIGVLHDVRDAPDELEQERPVDADEVALAEGPPDEPPQDVAPAVVGRRDAVADEEGHGPDVVGDDPDRDVAVVAGRVLAPGHGAGALDERHEQVGIEVAPLALDDRGDALEAHAGVDRRRGQRPEHPVRALVELHEDEVPELDEAVAALFDQGVGIARPRCPRRGRSGSRSRGRRGRCRPWPRNCPSSRSGRSAPSGRRSRRPRGGRPRRRRGRRWRRGGPWAGRRRR